MINRERERERDRERERERDRDRERDRERQRERKIHTHTHRDRERDREREERIQSFLTVQQRRAGFIQESEHWNSHPFSRKEDYVGTHRWLLVSGPCRILVDCFH